MNRSGIIAAAALVLCTAGVVFAFAGTAAVNDTLVGVIPSTATATGGPTFLDQWATLLAGLSTLVGFLVSIGLIKKYVPAKWLQALPNLIIPFLGSLITFLTVFNGPAQANAGIFGTIAHSVPWFVKVAGSLYAGGILPHNVYEVFVRGILECMGWLPANLTAAEKTAKSKVVGP